MSNLREIGFLLLPALLTACAAAPTPAARSIDEAAIRELVAATAAMNNHGDVEGWVGLFDDMAVYMPPGSPAVTTREGLLAMARAGFGYGRTDIENEPQEIVVSGDWAFARTRVSGTVQPYDQSKAAIPIDMKQIVIYRRQLDGRWKISRLIGNRNG